MTWTSVAGSHPGSMLAGLLELEGLSERRAEDALRLRR